MAEDLKIIIGADSSQLAAELTKAENELRKLQASLKKMSDVEAIEKTQRSIRYLQESIRDLNVESGKAGKVLGGELNKGANQASQSLLNMGRVVQDAPYGFMGIANNINPLLESFQRLKATTGSTGGALKELAASFTTGAGLGVAISIATSLLVVFGDKLFATSKKTDDAAEAAKKYGDTVKNIYSEQGKEGTQVISLIAILNNEVETRGRKLQALKDLKQINPDIFADLRLEGDLVKGLDAAYVSWLAHQKDVVAAKMLQAQIDAEITALIKEQGYTQGKMATAVVNGLKQMNTERVKSLRALGDQGAYAANEIENISTSFDRIKADKISAINGRIKDLADRLGEVSKGIDIKVDVEKVKKESDKLYNAWLKGFEKLQKWFKANRLSQELSPYGESIDIQAPTFQFNTEELNQSMRQGLIKAIKAMKLPSDLLNQIGGKIGLENLSLEGLTAFFKKFNDLFKKGAEQAQSDQGQILADLLSGTIFALAEGLGAAITNGAGSLKSVFSSLFSMFGDAAIQLGKNAILFSKGFLAIQAALKAGKPILGIGAGIALIAIGSLIKAGAAKLTPRFATGTSFTPGGMALVGERGPELVNIPRGGQVVPAGRTSQIMGGMGAVEVFGMLRGQDIYFSNKKYSQTYNRTT